MVPYKAKLFPIGLILTNRNVFRNRQTKQDPGFGLFYFTPSNQPTKQPTTTKMEKEYLKGDGSLEGKELSIENNENSETAPKYSSFISCTINLLKSTLGSGMLLLPYAFMRYGILLGIFVSLSAALLSSLGLSLLIFSANHAVKNGSCPPREVSYGSLATLTIGKWSPLVDLVMFVKCFLVSIQYLIVIRDNIPGIIAFLRPSLKAESSLLSNPKIQLLLCLLSISYFCFQPKMDALKVTSIFGLLGIAYLFVLGIWISINTAEETNFTKMNWFLPNDGNLNYKELLSFLSYFIFSYICHPSLLPIYNEVKVNTPSKMMKMVSLSIGGCFVSYAMFSMLYYGIYGSSLKPFILDHFSLDNGSESGGSASQFTYEFLLARIFFIILMIFTFPLQAFPARASLLKVISIVWKSRRRSCDEGRQQQQQQRLDGEEEKSFDDLSISAVPGGKDEKVFYLVTLVMLVVAFISASVIRDVKTLSSIVGASAGPLICYVFPAIFWIGLQKSSLSSSSSSFDSMKALSYTLLMFGVTLIPILFYSIIVS